MAFPQRRMRRLRRTPALRRLVAETRLSVDDLVAPLFVREGIDEPAAIASMPGQSQHTVASLLVEAKRLSSLGVPAIVLFGVPETKDATGSGASDPDGVVQVALRELRAALGDELVLIADLCLDEYTDHGHCGVLRAGGAGAGRGARAEVDLDVAEGADIVMVKPALTNLDVLSEVRRRVDVPICAYQVSGEYAMVKAADERGWIDGPAIASEQLLSIKRAGADFILTYFAGELAEALGG